MLTEGKWKGGIKTMGIKTMDDDNKFLLITLIVFILFSLIIYNNFQIDSLKKEIQSLESKVEDKKEFECTALADEFSFELDYITSDIENFKQSTKKEFENTWKSFGAVRRNFIAFGHGFHLEKNDIAPEEYWNDKLYIKE